MNSLIAFFFQAEDGIRAGHVTGVQTCALPISPCTRTSPGPRACSTGSPTASSPWTGTRSPGSASHRRTEEALMEEYLVVVESNFKRGSANYHIHTSGPLRSEERRVGKETSARCP